MKNEEWRKKKVVKKRCQAPYLTTSLTNSTKGRINNEK
jgi:hypothetical protein